MNDPQHRFRLGVTGGIGSGKSTVAALLTERGAALIDADAIAHAVTASGGAAIAALRSHFGPDAIDATGALDRARMRARVFADSNARQQLEAIVHPLVGQAIAAAAAQAQRSGARAIVYDIPLLTESPHWAAQLDAVLVVDCTETTQIERVQQRSGLTAAAVRAIMATQNSRAQRLAAADITLFNDGLTLPALKTKTHEIASRLGL